MDEHIVIKEIVSHLLQFLKSDYASGDTFYCKVICPKQYSLTHLIITVCHTCNKISDTLCVINFYHILQYMTHFVINFCDFVIPNVLCNKLVLHFVVPGVHYNKPLSHFVIDF